MKLYILTYNNYFNRKLLKLDNISDYKQYVVLTADNISFNPNDGRQTTQILNKYEKGDYLICTETKDEVETIVSRWFILEANRTRQGQYNLSLKRDVLADNLDVIEEAPMFIEKAMLQDTDKMIVNNEGMQFNQIKTNEILLKDKSNCPWIVGYVSKDLSSVVSTEIGYKPDGVNDYTTLGQIAAAIGTTEDILATLVTYPGETPINTLFTKEFYLTYKFRVPVTGIITNYQCDKLTIDSTISNGNWNRTDYVQSLDSLIEFKLSSPTYIEELTAKALIESILTYGTAIKDDIAALLNRSYYLTTEQFDKLKEYDGKTVLILGSYYKLRISQLGFENSQKIGPNAYSSFYSIGTAIDAATYPTGAEKLSTGELILQAKDLKASIILEAVEEDVIATTIPASRKVLNKEQFDMFAVPCGSLRVSIDNDYINCSEDVAFNIVSALATKLDAACYDIQLLPYCPVQDLLTNYKLDLSKATVNQDYQYITAATATESVNYTIVGYTSKSNTTYTKTYTFTGLTDVKVQKVTRNPGITSVALVSWSQSENTLTIIFTALSENDALLATFTVNYTHTVTNKHVGVILWLSDNQFKVKLDYPLSLTHSMKVESQADTYRLCSPNYQGSFDFNVAKNGGKVEYFQADCTYKPYTPYIRVYPKFDWLYGQDYSDCRGLICGGDFSLPRVNDAWTSYQLNNKNYQNIFNRDIQNLDFNNSIAMRNQAFSAISGIVSDTAKGAASGAMMGGGFGAIAGAIVGGAASTVGAIIDTDTLAKQQREQKQLSIDKYNYQLGNIQALPYTLTKVGAFDINSKLYPFIEYYTASDEEVKTLEDKITYESMTVMRIGTISEFKQDEPTYIKGQLIRLDNFHEDTNLVNDIYTELYKGVYY